MIARALEPPAPGQLRACALAALAEAGLVYLPAALVLDEARALQLGIEALALPFVAAYVAGAVLACRFRSSRSLVPAAGAVAVLAGVAIGGGGIDRTAFAVVVALLVALRVVTLALRDWRMPILGELGWGAVALGAEALLAAGAVPDWRTPLLAIVPAFFGAGLASRTATLWPGGEGAEDHAGSAWAVRALVWMGTLALASVVAVALATAGGAFDVLGRLVRPLVRVAGAVFFWLVVQAARPLFWLADKIHLDPEEIRRLLERLRASASRPRPGAGAFVASPWQRFLGLAVFVAIAYAIYRVLRRARPQVELEHRPRERRMQAVGELVADRLDPPPRWRFRRELPTDAVRRLYAEVLLDLREHAFAKEPGLTPAEFLPVVAAGFPPCTDDFAALTRSYEGVRYGNVRPDRDELRELEVRQRRLRSVLRRAGGGTVTPAE